MWLGGPHYLLSALTTAPEDATLEIEVFEPSADGRTPRSDVIHAKPKLGVVQTIWRAPALPLDDRGLPDLAEAPLFEVRDPADGARSTAPWPRTETLRVLVGEPPGASAASTDTAFRLWSSDGAYDRTVSSSEAVPASGRYLAVVFDDVPAGGRANLESRLGDGPWIPLFEDAEIGTLRDNCRQGRACRELPAVAPPPRSHGVFDEHPDRWRPDDDPDGRIQHAPW